MTDAVLVSVCRTAIGTAFKGTLTETTAFDLAHAVLADSLVRTQLSGPEVDDVILGESMYGGGDIARHAALTVGLTGVPGLAVNRHCAAGLTAISIAAAGIQTGMQDIVIAGGAHSTSTSPRQAFRTPGTQDFQEWWIPPTHEDRADAPNRDMSITVGWSAAVGGDVSRSEMDAWAYESHKRAINATDQGWFRDEIVPLKVTLTDGSSVVFDTDEHPRRTSTLEKLASLAPLHPEIDGFSITAGNAAGINDGAAAVVLMSAEQARQRGLTPLAVVRSWSSVGVDPALTGMSPSLVIPKALRRIGRSVKDVDVFEINEAFASVTVAAMKALSLDPAAVNPVGSGCSLGHPVAASGARMVVSLVNELRRRGGGTGVAAMCAGGGMGTAVVLDVHGTVTRTVGQTSGQRRVAASAAAQELARFLDSVLPAFEQEWGSDRSHVARLDWQRRLAGGRWVAPSWPEELGGRGLGVADRVACDLLLSERGAPTIAGILGVNNVGPTLAAWGTPPQRNCLPQILDGTQLWCQGFSEPDAGSDLASLRMTAVRDGDVYIVNGQKVWTSQGMEASHCQLLVRTDSNVAKHQGISALAISLDLPGIERRPLRQITGKSDFAEMFFTDVRVPVTCLLGPENQGWGVTMTTLAHERAGVITVAAMLETQAARLVEAHQRDGAAPLSTLHQDDVVRRYLEARVLAMMGENSLADAEAGGSPGPEQSLIKLSWSQLSQRLTATSLALCGLNGLADDPLSAVHAYLNARSSSIAGGTTEVIEKHHCRARPTPTEGRLT